MTGLRPGSKRLRTLRAAALALMAAGPALPAAAQPVFSQTETVAAAPGATLTFHLDELFDNAGTNPVFIGVGYPSPEYLDPSGTALDEDTRDSFTVTVRSAAELNALASPPPATFTFTAYVGVRNDEGQDASGTLTFETTYVRIDDGPAPSRPGESPASIVGAGDGG